MFPSFKNLADKERKRLELLDRAKRRVRQANEKRNLNAETAWASDADNSVSLSKSDQVDQGSQTDTLKKQSDLNQQEINVPVDVEIQVEPPSIPKARSPFETEPEVATPPKPIPVPTLSSEEKAKNWIKSYYGDFPIQLNPKLKTGRDGKQWIKAYFKRFPELAIHKLSLVGKNGEPLHQFYVGKNAEVFNRDTNRKITSDSSIDWLKSAKYLYSLLEDANKHYKGFPEVILRELSPIGENGKLLNDYYIGRDGDIFDKNHNRNVSSDVHIDWIRTATQLFNLLVDNPKEEERDFAEGKRPGEFISNTVNKSVVYTPGDMVNKKTDTDLDQIREKSALIWVLATYKDKLDTAVLEPVPVFKSNVNIDLVEPALIYRIVLKNDKLVVIKVSSGRDNPTIMKLIDWTSTLDQFIERSKQAGVDIDVSKIRKNQLTAISSRFKPADDDMPSRSGVSSGSNLHDDFFDNISLPEAEAKSFLIDFIKSAYTTNGIDKINIYPAMSGKSRKIQLSTKTWIYPKYSLIWHNSELRFKITNKQSDNMPSGAVFENLLKRVYWARTFDILVDTMETLRKARDDLTNNWFEQKKIDNTLALFTKISKRHGIEAIHFRVNNAINDDDLSTGQNHRTGLGLKGRGLRGAGDMKGRKTGSKNKTPAGTPVYAGIVRRGNGSYNLNDIQGTSIASAFIYKQIGSKYIRIPDLNERVLTIVRRGRDKVGPKREISAELQSMLKDLLYQNNISQAAYDQLSVDDQKLFKEILRITHVQHAFRDELPDPLGNLKMEYDKLKGEVMLGNDNPDILKQLKVLTVDMYSNKLIGDSEFKDIIIRLV